MQVILLVKPGQKKEGQATYIAPLQPPTLASFRTWGSSAGAGRVRLVPGCKSNIILWNATKLGNNFKAQEGNPLPPAVGLGAEPPANSANQVNDGIIHLHYPQIRLILHIEYLESGL